MDENEYLKIKQIVKDMLGTVTFVYNVIGDKKSTMKTFNAEDVFNSFNFNKYKYKFYDPLGSLEEIGIWAELTEKTGVVTIEGIYPETIMKNYLIRHFSFTKSSRLDKVLSVLASIWHNDLSQLQDSIDIAQLASEEKYHKRKNDLSYLITSQQVDEYLEKILKRQKKNKDTQNYFLYKYCNENNEVVYVGKTINLDNRIYAHTKDQLKDFSGKIFYTKINNKVNMDFLEYVLINKYHPCFNTQYNDLSISTDWNNEPQWYEYKIRR